MTSVSNAGNVNFWRGCYFGRVASGGRKPGGCDLHKRKIFRSLDFQFQT